MTRCTVILFLVVVVAGSSAPLSGAALEQLISRENPAFQAASARLAVGRDGMVYLCGRGNNSFVLRMNRDGQEKVGQLLGNQVVRHAVANRDGVMALAVAHFSHKIGVLDGKFEPIGSVADFLVGDNIGWDAPAHVEAGASGDFYGVDQYRNRILRIDATGRLLRAYPIPRVPDTSSGVLQEFRVCEKTEAFYLLARGGPIRCVGFDGKTRWTFNAGVASVEAGNQGGFDVDDAGTLYFIQRNKDAVQRVSAEGKPLAESRLHMESRRPAQGEYGFTDLRVHGKDVFLKRKHETELFQRYDLATGKLGQVVWTDHERLKVTLPDGPWTAGTAVPIAVALTAPGRPPAPRWRVWARPSACLDYREFPQTDGQLRVPAECAGIYQLKVTPELNPWQQGNVAEYQARTWIEIRQPNTKGTVSVWTPENRVYYGRGEEIPFHVSVRSADAGKPVALQLRLLEGARTLAEGQATLKVGEKAGPFVLPRALTAGLRPGNYAIAATAAGLTSVPQLLVLGPGSQRAPFHTVQYGDYGALYPLADIWDAPDRAAAHVRRTSKLGLNFMVDRLGEPGQRARFTWDARAQAELAPLLKRLEADPLATAPEKALSAPTLFQVQAGYSALGIEQMAILMMNDAGLPLGARGFDNRKPAQLVDDLTRVTKALAPYPSFRGWSWSSNWWLYEGIGSGSAKSPEEKTAYETAFRNARQTGAWDPVLDRVAGYRFGYAVDAQALFNKTLKPLAPDLVTASACSYRNLESYPPISLSNVEETDLQAQWEQIPVPYHAPHNVDFYKRPGKRAWAHPEILNDAGTGEQIVPTLFQIAMRGGDGVGTPADIPPWQQPRWKTPEDARSSFHCLVSIHRLFYGMMKPYGPWLSTLQNHDPVAIVVSGRPFKIDSWAGATGHHFAYLLEAYAACLHAHYPATFVFAEDLQPDRLKTFKILIVVGQTVELEPALAEALKTAQAAGATVFHDGTCRANVVKDFTPLGVSFDFFEKEPRPASNDAAWWNFSRRCRSTAPILVKAFAPIAPPPARVDNDQVLVSERRAEEGRYLFVVNQTLPELEPGLMWRMSLYVSSVLPALVPVGLGNDARHVYDVLALRKVTPLAGVVTADLRSIQARLFAVLPAEIAQVEVRGPEAVQAGEALAWAVAVKEANGKAIRAGIPVRVRLLDTDGRVLEEHFIAAGSQGAAGSFRAVRNASAGAQVLEATELFSGKCARLPVTVTPAAGVTLAVQKQTPERALPAPAPLKNESRSKESSTTLTPPENAFGPHIRDLVPSKDGKTALMNLMNWDENLCAVATDTGAVRWRRRVGHYFAFAPQTLENGFTVQGFDANTPEGYHLYLGDPDGKLERRFALYGLPGRLPGRYQPGMIRDRINNFAVADDGRWLASAGDLGLALWDRTGKLLWSLDWWKTNRHEALLAVLDSQTLLVVVGMQATAYSADGGQKLWQQTLAPRGEVNAVRVSRDGRTCAFLARTESGRVFVLRDGKPVADFPTEANDLALWPDGSLLAVTTGNQLKLYSLAAGLEWILPGDDVLHFPRVSPDGKRIVATSSLGTVYVVERSGKVLLERDLGVLSVPAWLPGGDLLLGTWMGTLMRLDERYAERWQTRLPPAEKDVRGELRAENSVPSVRVPAWGNAQEKPDSLTPNLLSPATTHIRYAGRDSFIQLLRDPVPLVDGKPEPPPAPWLSWTEVGLLPDYYVSNHILIDTYRARLRVTGITLVEDPAHPQSWLRDASLEYWDVAADRWVLAQPLLANAAVHTHRLARPIEASRFRIVLPWGLYGNLRLGEIVLHGDKIGPAHPDVFARRPVAVLFDEGNDLNDVLVHRRHGLELQYEGAHAGNRFLALRANAQAQPAAQKPFGTALPNWDFEIVEDPGPGQYRYLQFAWRAAAPETKGIALQLGPAGGGPQVCLYAGGHTVPKGVLARKLLDAPPTAWQVMNVDLWEVFKKPARIQTMSLASRGGAVAFDRILLGRSVKELEGKKEKTTGGMLSPLPRQ